MKILVTGRNGQVGWELSRSLMPLGEVVSLTRKQCDLLHLENLPRVIKEIKPDIIINAAAYTAVDKAEEEESVAMTINGTAVGVLAEEARKCNALFVHYSTDYVFDGCKVTPYIEEDSPNPINTYGRSKLAGEEAVRQIGGKYLIFRTSWVYAARGNNFAKTILRLASERDELSVVGDQFGAPTSAELIADITAFVLYKIINNSVMMQQSVGIYHLTAAGRTSWYGYAQWILEIATNAGKNLRLSPEQLLCISTTDYPVPAKRPLNSSLSTDKLSSTFGLVLSPWQQYVERAVVELMERL